MTQEIPSFNDINPEVLFNAVILREREWAVGSQGAFWIIRRILLSGEISRTDGRGGCVGKIGLMVWVALRWVALR